MVIEAPNEDCRIKFHSDSRGQMETIPKSKWAKYIRLVKREALCKLRDSACRVAWEGSLEEDNYSKPLADQRRIILWIRKI